MAMHGPADANPFSKTCLTLANAGRQGTLLGEGLGIVQEGTRAARQRVVAGRSCWSGDRLGRRGSFRTTSRPTSGEYPGALCVIS